MSHLFKPDYLLGIATCVLLRILLSARQPARARAFFVRVSRWLASFSYSLYLVHYPLLALLAALLVGDRRRWFPDGPHLLLGLGYALLALVYGLLVAHCTEVHTDRWREAVERRLGLRAG